MLENGKDELLKNSRLFLYERKMIKFLKNPQTVDNINSIEFGKLKLILFTKMLSNKLKRKLLKNEGMVVALNSIDVVKIQILLVDAKDMIEFIAKNLLTDIEAINALNEIDYEILKLLFEKGKFHNFNLILQKNQNQNKIKNELQILKNNLKEIYKINFTDDERFKFDYTVNISELFQGDESENHSILYEILKSENMIDGLNLIDEEKLDLLINNREERGYNIILWLIKNVGADAINFIKIEKLKLLLNCDKLYNDYILMEMMKNEEIIDALNWLEDEKISILNDEGRFDGFCMATVTGSIKTINAINSINVDDLKILLKNGKLCTELMGWQTDLGLGDDVEMLFKNDLYYYNAIRRVIRIKNTLSRFSYIDIEKFQILAQSGLFDFSLIMTIFETEHAVKAINSMSEKNFNLLVKMKYIDLIEENLMNFGEEEISTNLLKNFVLNVLLDRGGANSIKVMPSETLTLMLTNWTKNGNLFKKILKSTRLFRRLNSISDYKLKIVIENFNQQNLSQIIENSYAIDGLNSIEYERLNLLLEYKTINHGLITCLLKHKDAVNLINSIEFTFFEKLLQNNELIEKIILELFGVENLTRKHKLQLLLKVDEYCDYIISQLMIKKDAFNLIDLMEMERFVILVNCKKLFKNLIGAILKSRFIICRINHLSIDRIKLISRIFDGLMIYKILKSQKTVDGINLINVDKFEFLYDSEQLISDDVIYELLRNTRAINIINYINFDDLAALINRGEILNEIILRLNASTNSDFVTRLLILLNDPKHRTSSIIKLFKNCNFLNYNITYVDIEKFKILLGIDNRSLLSILKCKSQINLIKKFDKEILKLFIRHKKLYNLDKKDSISIINSIGVEKLELIVQDVNILNCFLLMLEDENMINLIKMMNIEKFAYLIKIGKFGVSLNDENVVKSINLINEEKLGLLFNYWGIRELLNCQNSVQNLHSMDIEKIEVLLKVEGGFRTLKSILSYESSFIFVNMIEFDKLKILLKMTNYTRFTTIAKCDEDDVKKNLNFAIALYKIGIIEKVSCKFLRDNKAIHDEIMQLFSEEFPIDQILVPSNENEYGVVPSLKNMSLEVLVSHADDEHLRLVCPAGFHDEVSQDVIICTHDQDQDLSIRADDEDVQLVFPARFHDGVSQHVDEGEEVVIRTRDEDQDLAIRTDDEDVQLVFPARFHDGVSQHVDEGQEVVIRTRDEDQDLAVRTDDEDVQLVFPARFHDGVSQHVDEGEEVVIRTRDEDQDLAIRTDDEDVQLVCPAGFHNGISQNVNKGQEVVIRTRFENNDLTIRAYDEDRELVSSVNDKDQVLEGCSNHRDRKLRSQNDDKNRKLPIRSNEDQDLEICTNDKEQELTIYGDQDLVICIDNEDQDLVIHASDQDQDESREMEAPAAKRRCLFVESDFPS